jgi:hypothetical protein
VGAVEVLDDVAKPRVVVLVAVAGQHLAAGRGSFAFGDLVVGIERVDVVDAVGSFEAFETADGAVVEVEETCGGVVDAGDAPEPVMCVRRALAEARDRSQVAEGVPGVVDRDVGLGRGGRAEGSLGGEPVETVVREVSWASALAAPVRLPRSSYDQVVVPSGVARDSSWSSSFHP